MTSRMSSGRSSGAGTGKRLMALIGILPGRTKPEKSHACAVCSSDGAILVPVDSKVNRLSDRSSCGEGPARQDFSQRLDSSSHTHWAKSTRSGIGAPPTKPHSEPSVPADEVQHEAIPDLRPFPEGG